jgi:hypothetical protein
MFLEYGQMNYSANGNQIVTNYPGGPLVKVMNNGHSGLPTPGDVLSFGSNSTFGHTGVVTAVTSSSVTWIEQNSQSSGVDSTSIVSGVISSDSYNGDNTIGWLHDPNGGSANVTAAADPVVVNGGPNAMDMFVVGADGALYHRWYNSGTWQGWESLGQPGATLVGDPSVLINHPNPLDIYVRGTNGALYHRWFNTSWHPWEQLASNAAGDPVAAAGSNFTWVDVYYRDSSGILWSAWYNGSVWSTAYIPGSASVQGKPAVYESPNLIGVYVQGTSQQVWTNTFTGTWGTWTYLQGHTNGDPSVAMTRYGELDLYAPGTNGVPYYCNSSSGGCANGWWGALPQSISGDVSVTTAGPNTQDNFYHDGWGSLYHSWNLGGGEDLGGGIIGTPAVAGGSPDPLEVFVRGTDNVIYWKWWTGTQWYGYMSMGTQVTGTQ